MATRLVTIATFDMPPKAELARNALTAAGIQSVLGDDNTLGMDWLLGNAIGWVKLQVREEDAEKAVAVLEEALGMGEAVDQAELSAEAEAAELDDELERRDQKDIASRPDEDVPSGDADSREQLARRVFFTGWFSIIIPLVAFYGLYLMMNAAFGKGSLSGRGRFHLILGSIFVCCALVLDYWYLQLFAAE